MKRLLILSVSAGAGHTRAAMALEKTARALWPRTEVLHRDVLDFTEPVYRKGYVQSYLEMVNRAPDIWGYLYSASDRPPKRNLQSRLVRLFDRLEFARFRRFVRDFDADAVLTTHFLPCQVFAPYRKRGRDRFPLGVVLTDFDAHAYWVQPTADRFFVATAELSAILAGRGITKQKISVTGIPIMPAFAKRHDRRALRARWRLSARKLVILVMSGGAGVGALVESARRTLAAGPVQVLAVAGRNEKARKELESLVPPSGSVLRVFGFVEDVSEPMAVADLVVGKSGGLTTAECLAMGVPIIVRDPIPGQEERNCDFLLEASAGVRANGEAALSFKLESLLSNPARLRRMSRAARRAGRPKAAEKILKAVERESRL
ncbi:MAG TPA: glycosyltransferase [Thermoanaerobaculia bacterium]